MFFITKVIIMLLAHLMRTIGLVKLIIIVLLLAALPVMVGRYLNVKQS